MPELTLEDLPDGIARTARKRWRCCCADQSRGWDVTGRYNGGRAWTSTWVRLDPEDPAGSLALAEQKAEQMRGRPATSDGKPYETVELVPRANPEHRGGELAEACRGWIEPGDRHFEYLGDAAPYQSGTRYCEPCALTVWASQAVPS